MMKAKLYPFQTQILSQTSDFNRVAYYLDMGLGKTFVGAEKMVQLGKRINLIVCQKSKIKDWIEHFKTYYPLYYVYDLTNKNGFQWFNEIGEDIHKIGVINYELAWRRKDLLKFEDFTLMLDESSLIQNRKAKQSKFILRLDPANVILLSGTPTSGKYENLWTQIHLLDWQISENTYNSQYVNWEKLEIGWGTNSKIVSVVNKKTPYKNVERLKSKMREHGAVFMKTEEVLELPEQIITEIEVNVSKEYRKFQKDSIITIDTKNLCEFHDDSDFYGRDVTPRVELVGDTELTKRLYSRQLCGAYSKEKLQAFRDLIESTNDRVIVFYNFTEELKAMIPIARHLKKPFGIVNGERKELEPYDMESDSITFVQYQAGAMGLNLQKANKIIYFTLPDGRQDLFDQSMKRIHRIGQKNNCFYYILICRDSVEEEIKNTLEIRKEYTERLFEDENNI